MKKKTIKRVLAGAIAVSAIVAFSLIYTNNAKAEPPHYSCTVTTQCCLACGGGSVKCTGVEECSKNDGWVKCDGHKTDCCSDPND